MENHFYHIKWPPLNVAIFIMYTWTYVMGAMPMTDMAFGFIMNSEYDQEIQQSQTADKP